MDGTLSVALINSDTRPYWMDTVDLLFAPEGYDYSSRYQWKWVNEGVDPRGLKGQRVLLIFLGTAQGGEYYLPLREATVSEVSDHGPFVVIRYRLGRFVDLTASSHDFAVRFDRHLRLMMDAGNMATGHAGQLVLPLGNIDIGFSTKEMDDDHNWANMVKEVVRSKIFSGSVFLRFHGLVEDESGAVLTMEEGRFLLRSGRVYRMDIVQYLPTLDGENAAIERPRTTDLGKIELETMEMHMDALEDELEVVGRYDDHSFFFVVKRVTEKTYSRMAVVGKGADKFYIPSLVFQVQIASYRLVFLGYVGFLAGLIIIGLSTLIPGAEFILAAGGSVISTAGLLFLER
jgi:hypothetical protein